jgi:alkylated DNA repair dioxygenase AlkB
MTLDADLTQTVAAGQPDPSASSGFGGGPPGPMTCGVSPLSASATPPHTELGGTNLTGPGFTFSTKTCLELVDKLDPIQLNREFNLFKLNNTEVANSCRTRTSTCSVNKMRDLLKNALTNNVCKDYDAIVQNFNSISDSFSYIAEKVDEYATIVRAHDQHIRPAATSLLDDSDTASFFSPSSDPGNAQSPICEPVSIFKSTFDSITLKDATSNIDFSTRVGSRHTAYFGTHEYAYGRSTHRPQQYPALPLFDTIFEEVVKLDPTFTRDNFSCLATLYKNGNCTIPQHSDDEHNIEVGSTIYTLSLGETREMSFLSTDGQGPLQSRTLELTHGQMFSMTAESQKFWAHSIERDTNRTGARVSLTFRHVTAMKADKPVVPPISRPAKRDIAADLLTPTDSQGNRYKRVLLLTDSIHQGFPPGKFNKLGPYRCIRKMNYQLADFMNFHPEFRHSDIVILSAGVNDLCRYKHTAESLADVVCKNLADSFSRYPNTRFIFNCPLLTAIDWLNSEIHRFSQYMHTFCTQHSSHITFFDSHQVLMESGIQRVLSQPRLDHTRRPMKMSNGIHITLEAQIAITDELVNLVGNLHARKWKSFSSKYYHWVNYLRPDFRPRVPT